MILRTIQSAEPLPLGRIRLVWGDGSESVVDLSPLLAQGGEERTFLHQPTSPVQKHERRTIASLEDAAPAATAGDIEQKRATAHGRISAVARPGTTRCGSGWIQKRSSPS